MLEEERKYEAGGSFTMPDLAAALPPGLTAALPPDGTVVSLPPVTLTATYFDTADLRLARAGVSLRHRRGDRQPWTVKLPADAPGIRHEISRPGRRTALPSELAALVTVYARGADLVPAVVVRTVRQAYELRAGADDGAADADADANADDGAAGAGEGRADSRPGRLLAEVADDAVTVLDGRRVRATFREIEVERVEGDRELLDRVGDLLCQAGATAGDFVPKHVRALGEAATGAPDLVAPGALPARPTAGHVVTAAIRSGVDRILSHDPLVRLRAPVGDDDSAVHQMRVGCRRLRSDLRTFAPLVRPEWAKPLRDELKWLAGVLGGARDAEVLRDRLRRTAATDPLAVPDRAAVDRMDALLAARQEQALRAVDEALTSPRYLALVEALVAATRTPPLTSRAEAPAGKALPGLVSKPWRRLTGESGGGGRKHGGGGAGAAALRPLAADERWHAVRVNGKKARYAVDAVAPVIGGGARKLARRLSRVQNLLGEHQDAAVAAGTWLSVAGERPDDHALAVTAGRLYERERARIHQVRAEFPDAWRRTTKKKVTRWLR